MWGGARRFRLLFRDGPSEATPEALQRFMQKLWQEVRCCQLLACMGARADGCAERAAARVCAHGVQIERSEEAWPFREPVSRDDVADYYDVIKVRAFWGA